MINDFYNDNQISGQTRKKLTSDMFNGPQGIFQEGCVGSAWGKKSLSPILHKMYYCKYRRNFLCTSYMRCEGIFLNYFEN